MFTNKKIHSTSSLLGRKTLSKNPKVFKTNLKNPKIGQASFSSYRKSFKVQHNDKPNNFEKNSISSLSQKFSFRNSFNLNKDFKKRRLSSQPFITSQNRNVFIPPSVIGKFLRAGAKEIKSNFVDPKDLSEEMKAQLLQLREARDKEKEKEEKRKEFENEWERQQNKKAAVGESEKISEEIIQQELLAEKEESQKKIQEKLARIRAKANEATQKDAINSAKENETKKNITSNVQQQQRQKISSNIEATSKRREELLKQLEEKKKKLNSMK